VRGMLSLFLPTMYLLLMPGMWRMLQRCSFVYKTCIKASKELSGELSRGLSRNIYGELRGKPSRELCSKLCKHLHRALP